MRKVEYLAVFEPSSDGYGVYFPDLVGCISFGTSFDDARKSATDALGLHIYGMEKDGEALPDATSDPTEYSELQSGCIVAPITVFPDMVANELDNRRVKTNVTLPAWLKNAAESRGVNFSKLLEAALLEYIEART